MIRAIPAIALIALMGTICCAPACYEANRLGAGVRGQRPRLNGGQYFHSGMRIWLWHDFVCGLNINPKQNRWDCCCNGHTGSRAVRDMFEACSGYVWCSAWGSPRGSVEWLHRWTLPKWWTIFLAIFLPFSNLWTTWFFVNNYSVAQDAGEVHDQQTHICSLYKHSLCTFDDPPAIYIYIYMCIYIYICIYVYKCVHIYIYI